MSTYNGVIVALKANIWFVNTSAVAVFVAAALRGAVVPHESKVTLANSRGHTRPVHTALCTHWLTLTRNTVQEKNKKRRLGGNLSSYYEKQNSIFFSNYPHVFSARGINADSRSYLLSM